uniref:Uncharacterized protein n=1 Tax=Fagus sylvatica TaxID=28930 RepID=A0A2N9ECS3_FAGSY
MPEQVGYILGLRTSGPPVTDEGELKDIEFLCEKHGFRGTETVTLGSLECALGAKDAILFYDKVVASLRVLPLSRRPPIRLSVWTQRRIKLLQHHLKKHGGYNNTKLLGTNDDHPAKNEKEANKEEKKKSVVIDDDEGIILEELREDFKCMKLQLIAFTGLVTETIHKGVASMITELLTTLKSDILQEIAKGTAGTVPNTHFAHQGVPNRPSTYQGVHNTPSTHQTVPNSPFDTKETPIALWNRMDSSISLRLK